MYQSKGNYGTVWQIPAGTSNVNFKLDDNQIYLCVIMGGGEILLFLAGFISQQAITHDILKSTTHFSHPTAGTTLGLYRGGVSAILTVFKITYMK